MAAVGKDRNGREREARGAREARERAKLYRARQDFHAELQRRSRRDNLIAGLVGGAIVLGAIGSQVAYFTAGPGAPEPTPSPSVTSTSEPTPANTTPAATPEATPGATP